MQSNIFLQIKPLSVNECRQGQRFKTPKYRDYERLLLGILPQINPTVFLGKIELVINWGFSSSQSDIDNPTKPILDILQKKYGFNDKNIFRIILEKEIVGKGGEYIKILFRTYNDGKEKTLR